MNLAELKAVDKWLIAGIIAIAGVVASASRPNIAAAWML